jgi:hypothetical protein
MARARSGCSFLGLIVLLPLPYESVQSLQSRDFDFGLTGNLRYARKARHFAGPSVFPELIVAAVLRLLGQCMCSRVGGQSCQLYFAAWSLWGDGSG